RLVGLREGQCDEDEQREEPACRDGGRKRRGVRDVPRQEDDRAEPEEQRVGDEVADASPPERSPRRAGEARVVGGKRNPRHGDPDDDVDSLPGREPALAGPRPRLLEPAARERPPGEIGNRERHDPHRDPPDDRAHDADRAEQAHHASKPRSSSESAAAAVAITSSSKTVQPRHWTTLIAVGRYEPRSPSGARISTIAGTRACAPIAPATASIRFPTRQPTRIATSAVGSESAGTSTAPATITSSETPRFPHRRPMSTPPSTRSR